MKKALICGLFFVILFLNFEKLKAGFDRVQHEYFVGGVPSEGGNSSEDEGGAVVTDAEDNIDFGGVGIQSDDERTEYISDGGASSTSSEEGERGETRTFQFAEGDHFRLDRERGVAVVFMDKLPRRFKRGNVLETFRQQPGFASMHIFVEGLHFEVNQCLKSLVLFKNAMPKGLDIQGFATLFSDIFADYTIAVKCDEVFEDEGALRSSGSHSQGKVVTRERRSKSLGGRPEIF